MVEDLSSKLQRAAPCGQQRWGVCLVGLPCGRACVSRAARTSKGGCRLCTETRLCEIRCDVTRQGAGLDAGVLCTDRAVERVLWMPLVLQWYGPSLQGGN